ncbi:DUF397 domain-containing protein [Streptomyces griseorubiginosus]|nr:DUF397 domain-containing protein [Streptomyces griseorubiginosus]
MPPSGRGPEPYPAWRAPCQHGGRPCHRKKRQATAPERGDPHATQTDLDWFKSSYSSGDQSRVDVARTPGIASVRDSKKPHGPAPHGLHLELEGLRNTPASARRTPAGSSSTSRSEEHPRIGGEDGCSSARCATC